MINYNDYCCCMHAVCDGDGDGDVRIGTKTNDDDDGGQRPAAVRYCI